MLSRIIIIGAGEAGALLVQSLRSMGHSGYEPIGYVDDNPTLLGKRVQDVPVLGKIKDIPKLCHQFSVEQIVLSIPSLSADALRQVVHLCKDSGARLLSVPNLLTIGDDTANITHIAPLQPEALLGRDPVQLDWQGIEQFLANKVVMITGGAGSIGSGLCEQILRCGIRRLVVIDHSELALYELQQRLQTHIPVDYCLASIQDKQLVHQIMSRYRPDVIFHAAAYKHVPLLEAQPTQALQNNVLATQYLAQCAIEHQVSAFVFISTDKAVNPSNIMGRTKRLAEQYCHAANTLSETQFMAVRFGNVLGSSGSVVPLFAKQIQQGGPVTVTDPEMERYFMTIPEACQLVLQAVAIGQGGEIFVLDMGQPIKIVDLAEQMLYLSGRHDIEIQFTGLRPGEKLSEQLCHHDETLKPTKQQKILLVARQETSADINALDALFAQYQQAVDAGDQQQLQELLN